MKRYHEEMNEHGSHHHHTVGNSGCSVARRFTFGFLLIGAGLVWLGANLGFIPEIVKEYVISWQALLIGFGLVGMVGKKSNFWFSLLLVFIGSLFLFAKYNELPVDIGLIIWPVVLVFAGLAVISKVGNVQKWKRRVKKNTLGADYLDDTNIFGGGKFNVTSKNFKGGQSTNIFGGSEIDFTHAELQEGDTEIEISCIFGGVKFILPADWNVVIDVDQILGGVADKRQIVTDKHVDYSRRLIIKGSCVFGGGEIESVVRR